MGLTDTFFGSPGQTTIHQAPGTKPPGFGFAKDFFNSLMALSRQPYPTYPGQLDPGLSPTMQSLLRQAQGYSQAGPPEILAGVQGSLGRFMNPSFINPAARVPMGYQGFFSPNPSVRGFNGQPFGNFAGYGGASGAAPPFGSFPGAPPAGGITPFGVPPGMGGFLNRTQQPGNPAPPAPISDLLAGLFRSGVGGQAQQLFNFGGA